jgi:hypothetical protein
MKIYHIIRRLILGDTQEKNIFILKGFIKDVATFTEKLLYLLKFPEKSYTTDNKGRKRVSRIKTVYLKSPIYDS